MDLPVVKSKKLEDGIHNGVIEEVEYRTEPYAYTDVVVKMSDGFTLKVGYPTVMSEDSALGQLMIRFGEVLAEGGMCNPDILKGKKCNFQTTTALNKKDGKSYSNIIRDSVRPI